MAVIAGGNGFMTKLCKSLGIDGSVVSLVITVKADDLVRVDIQKCVTDDEGNEAIELLSGCFVLPFAQPEK